ncbi:MAG: hypothetical protein CL760_01665 [Chloroflexi bacterium]|nr:hypothetical protein [Chloroflexota bacterium]|tara:strand:- start:46039 stop:46380 length:342 start_codon:yes stop_codon:yes gene_type:complete
MNELKIKSTIKNELNAISKEDKDNLSSIRMAALNKVEHESNNFFLKPIITTAFIVPLIFLLNMNIQKQNISNVDSTIASTQFDKNVYEWTDNEFVYAMTLDTYEIEIEDYYLY